MRTIRLLLVWAVVALVLQTWAGLTGPGAPPGPLGGDGIALARPPTAPILTLWVHWEASHGGVGWVALESAGAPPAAGDAI